MRELYTKENLSGLDAGLTRRWIVLGIVSAVFIAGFVWTMVIRAQWHELQKAGTFPLSETAMEAVSTACVVLAGFFAVFWIDLFCRPLLRHRKLIREALTGRNHMRTMEFVRIEPDPSMVDGVSCRSMIFLGEPDKHGTREQLFYWDASIPLPDLQSGTEYTLKHTGRTIIAINA